MRLADVDVVVVLFFLSSFLSSRREGRGGGKIQDLILSIYRYIRQKMKTFLVMVVLPQIDRTRQLARNFLFFFLFFFSSSFPVLEGGGEGDKGNESREGQRHDN